MKHLKSFENTENEPQIGDYVYLSYEDIGNIFDEYCQSTKDFVKNNIGKITNIKDVRVESYSRKFKKLYYIRFYNDKLNVEFDNNDFTIIVNTSNNSHNTSYELRAFKQNIINFSENKEDLEPLIQSNKYNL